MDDRGHDSEVVENSETDTSLPGKWQILEGFVANPRRLSVRERKAVVFGLSARLVCARQLLSTCSPPSPRAVADAIGVSERTVHRYFPRWEAMLAFPPPEMAKAIVAFTAGVDLLNQLPGAIWPLIEALGHNEEGCALLADLAVIHETHPEVAAADNHFATEMLRCLVVRDGPSPAMQTALVGYFTEALRVAITTWASASEQSTATIDTELRQLIATRPPAPPKSET